MQPDEVAALRNQIAGHRGLVNVAAIAAAWNVTTERARQLTARGDFPMPIGHIGTRRCGCSSSATTGGTARGVPDGRSGSHRDPDRIRDTRDWPAWPWLPMVRWVGEERQLALIYEAEDELCPFSVRPLIARRPASRRP